MTNIKQLRKNVSTLVGDQVKILRLRGEEAEDGYLMDKIREGLELIAIHQKEAKSETQGDD